MALARVAAGACPLQDPTYGYGERGSFSFPAVPPNSKLVYRLEVISWEAIEEVGRGSAPEQAAAIAWQLQQLR